MGVKTVITAACDLKDCNASVTWNKEEVERDNSLMPVEAKYLVIFTVNGVQRVFCCQLHAAEYFLPPGYEAVQKKIIELPVAAKQDEVMPPWLRRKPVEPCTVISRSESEPIPQADGDSSPENGPGGGQRDGE